MLIVHEERCAACGQCHLVCPSEAFKDWGVVTLDREKCVECYACVDYCPTDALEEGE
jgi:NAD-dependent dihydropyrimidine dehydrogenase PreA subunit